jgi:hypothetical protein
MEQRTEEWFAARCGKVTASRVADIIAKTKTGPSASRENYLAQLVCERLTGKPAESYSNSAMQWGTETEPFARAAYEARWICWLPRWVLLTTLGSPCRVRPLMA